MKVTDFARLLGLPASKVRYYDQQGLIRGSRGRNNYRHFTPQDALDIYHAQMLRSFDMSIQQSLEAKGSQLEEINGWVGEHITELEESIRLQEMKLQRLQSMQRYFEMVSQTPGAARVVERMESHNVWTFGASGELPGAPLETIRTLADAMPFSYIAIRVSRESLLSPGEDLDVAVGLGILERSRAQLGLELSPQVTTVPGGPSLNIVLEVSDPFALKKRDLAPLLEEIRRRGLELNGDLVGRLFLSYTKGGQFVHGLGLGLNLN